MQTIPGHIYFLKERDFLTGEESPYVKIGLVREDKTTEERIKEHQTGNPRQILDYHTLPMRFVEHGETLLHYIFGEQWITGEWFKLTTQQLQEAIEEGYRINAEQEAVADAYLHAEQLKTTPSNGALIGAREDELELHRQAVEYKNTLTVLNAQLKLCKNKVLSYVGTKAGIEGVLDTKFTEESTTWDTKAFKENHPELFEQFSVVKTKVGGAFLLQGASSLKVLDEQLKAALAESKFDSPIVADIDRENLAERTNELEQLHLNYIQLNKEIYLTNWKYDQVIAQLQSRMGNYFEMEGIAKWKREEKGTKSLNKKALFEVHPELEEQYTIEKPANVSYVVRNWREY